MYVRLDSGCSGNNTSLEQKIIRNFRLEISLEHKSKVSQKPCCNDLCQVAIVKELVNGKLESYMIQHLKEITQSHKCARS